MSCGNSKQQLERAGVYALAICTAPYRNSDNIITVCGCPFSEHLNEAPAPPPGSNLSAMYTIEFLKSLLIPRSSISSQVIISSNSISITCFPYLYLRYYPIIL